MQRIAVLFLLLLLSWIDGQCNFDLLPARCLDTCANEYEYECVRVSVWVWVWVPFERADTALPNYRSDHWTLAASASAPASASTPAHPTPSLTLCNCNTSGLCCCCCCCCYCLFALCCKWCAALDTECLTSWNRAAATLGQTAEVF